MTKSNCLVFIVADERYNAGERDYAKALVAQIQSQGLRDNTEYLFYKIPPMNAEAARTALKKGGNPSLIPATDKEYASVPVISAAAIEILREAKNVKIIGAGHSTLNAVIELSSLLPVRPEANYISHMVDDADQLGKIVENNVHLFTPTKRENLAGLSSSLTQKLVDKALFTELDAVPHTNSLASCKIEYASFLNKSPNGKKVQQIVKSGQPFAFVVINAGFDVGPGKIYTPYLEQEARKHGAALGRFLPSGTHLIAAHGGPRNLRDEAPSAENNDTHIGQKTIDVFTEAYRDAQKEQAAPLLVIKERFEQGLPYNVIKAGYVLGRLDACKAFVSNSEGYGTMDGAVLHISNQDKILGMFPFGAQYLDPTGQRLANIEKYKKQGVSILSAPEGRLAIERQEDQKTTPHRIKDSAETIVQFLELAKGVNPEAPRRIWRKRTQDSSLKQL